MNDRIPAAVAAILREMDLEMGVGEAELLPDEVGEPDATLPPLVWRAATILTATGITTCAAEIVADTDALLGYRVSEMRGPASLWLLGITDAISEVFLLRLAAQVQSAPTQYLEILAEPLQRHLRRQGLPGPFPLAEIEQLLRGNDPRLAGWNVSPEMLGPAQVRGIVQRDPWLQRGIPLDPLIEVWIAKGIDAKPVGNHRPSGGSL